MSPGSGSEPGPGAGPQFGQTDELARLARERLREGGAADGDEAGLGDRGREPTGDRTEAMMEKAQDVSTTLPDTGDSGGERGGAADKVKEKLPETGAVKEKLPDGGAVKEKRPDGEAEEVKGKAKQAAGAAQDHPVAVTAGAAAAGLVAGLAIPETDVEREKLGPPAKNLNEQVQSTAQELLDRTKEAAKDISQSAAQAAKESGRAQGEKLGEVAKGSAAGVGEEAKGSAAELRDEAQESAEQQLDDPGPPPPTPGSAPAA